ncbi:hypothetical protein SCP_1102160 [Sparassis crispa]|uniref:F-box domain-containing protein n=1 Tax=Sparassis crispa TaxID=139825 RepID=A0A401GZH0_9APHY|nr:hypothetical protein SCP_1102160 [Sparassis crispa]GBE87539.1 hypothetical protein SCP_1102160 [Sparassis crispa]
MGQERIAAGIHSCLVTPTEYLKHGRDRYNHCLDDPRERVILDFFFDDLLPKLVNLKHLELARITLTSFHLRCLRNVPIIHSLHVETCFSKEDEHGDEESLHDRLDALPVKHLVFQQMPIDWTSPNVYVPLPQPALLESLSFYMFQPARQDLFEDPYHNLLPWLTSLGPFPSLRSLNVVWVPCGAQCDWRPFISSHCPSLERLSIVQSVGAKLDATPQQFPSLKFFRGTWNDARLYGFGPGCSGLQHLLVSAKCAQIPIRAREDRTLTDSTALSGPVVLAGLNESPGGFAHLESLKISMYDVSDELITRLFRCCPRLRALKIDSRVLYRFRENGLSALASVLIAAVSLPDLEYMSLCFVNVATEERPQLDRMIYFLSSQLRVHCPKLRYVHIAPVPGRISEEGYCTVRFDPVGARWLIQDYSIESWWNGIVIGHTLSLRRLESFNTRITEARAAVMPLFLRFLVS